MPRGQELIIILIVIAVLFGAKRLPDSARSLVAHFVFSNPK